jgi:UDP-N-acetylglucosamine 4,6-dehydratase
MQGGEIFVPKMPSARVADLARVAAPDCEREVIGIRPGEKLHETLIPPDESHRTIEFEDYYVIQPTHSFWNQTDFLKDHRGRPCPDGFRYSSDTNPWQLTERNIHALIAEVERDPHRELPPIPSEPRFIVGG